MAIDGVQARDVIVDVMDVQRDKLATQECGRLIVGRRFEAPGKSRGDQRGGRRVRAGKVVPGREGVGAHLARLCGEKEADGEEHDLGQPPGPAGDQPRRGADFVQYVVILGAEPDPVPEEVRQLSGSAQVTERELGACYEQFGLFGAGHAGTGVPSCEQPAVVKQIQPV